MLTIDEKRELIKKNCKGKRIWVKSLVGSLWGLTPRDPGYRDAYNEVAAIINRNTEISIRVTDVELAELKSRASKTKHRGLADFIRSAALGVEITTPPPVQVVESSNNTLDIRAAVRALQGIGKNLNQLALNLNVFAKHHIITPEDVTKYRAEIERLLDALKKIEIPGEVPRG